MTLISCSSNGTPSPPPEPTLGPSSWGEIRAAEPAGKHATRHAPYVQAALKRTLTAHALQVRHLMCAPHTPSVAPQSARPPSTAARTAPSGLHSQSNQRHVLLVHIQVLNEAVPQEVVEPPLACARVHTGFMG